MEELVEIIKYLVERQRILAEIVIHFGCRADLYDGFVSERFNQLQNLRAPEFKFKKGK